MKACVEKISGYASELLKTYQDEEFMLKDEVDNIRCGSDMLSGFYEALNATKEYHTKYPSELPQAATYDVSVDVLFSGEEIFGKYLDLNDHYQTFANLAMKYSIEQDYLQYLERFNNFFYLPEGLKASKAYLDYLQQLFEYLYDFFGKVHPLVDLGELMREWRAEFEQRCLSGQAPGYKLSASSMAASSAVNGSSSAAPQELRLGMFGDVKELEALGMDRLKEALEAAGLKCGGTLQERAGRLWSVRGKKAQDYPPSIVAKAKKRKHSPPGDATVKTVGSNGDSNSKHGSSSDGGGAVVLCEYDKDTSRNRIVRKENDVQCLCELMSDIVVATRKHAEKQQTRTMEEKEAEIQEEEFGLLPEINAGEDSDDEDDEPIYNPLNIPLGWDGKPIPYWLYKLHGLGNEFKCEICGNQSYWGRRAFDRHFQEAKHAAGMRSLGVPNSKHFHDITLIEDALALHAKLSGALEADKFVRDLEEEFEDSEGNILNRRTYEDLARQGLL